MSVQELIELLQKFPPQMLVVMSRDSEGNGYGPLHAMGQGYYNSGEFVDTLEYVEEYFVESVQKTDECVCLWPGW